MSRRDGRLGVAIVGVGDMGRTHAGVWSKIESVTLAAC